MLYVEEQARNEGYGRRLVNDWEKMMFKQGYKTIMTSTQSDESAQHFYRKLGYIDRGGIFLPNEAMEIILMKVLKQIK